MQVFKGLVEKTLFQPRHKNILITAAKRHTVGLPPRRKMSFSESIVAFVGLGVAMFGYPMWVMYHLYEYQGIDREELFKK